MQKTRFTSVLSTFIVCYVFWILLTWSLSPEELAAGAVVSFFVALFSAKYFIHENAGWLFRPDKFFALLAYFVVFLGLLIKSNLNVAKCCYKGCKDVYPGIVKIPTKLKGDYAQAMLANSTTLTPGTITLDIIEENGETAYYVHCLDVSQYEDKNFYYTDEDGKEKPLPLHRSREDAGEDIKGTMEKWIRRIWE